MAEKPKYIEPQSFRSVREAGYAEEDVDLYSNAITESYNRMIDAYYDASVAKEEAEAAVKVLEDENSSLKETIVTREATIADQENSISVLNDTVNTLKSETGELKDSLVARDSDIATLNEKILEAENVEKSLREELEHTKARVVELENVASVVAEDTVAIDHVEERHIDQEEVDSTIHGVEDLLKSAERIAADHIANAERVAAEKLAEVEDKIAAVEAAHANAEADTAKRVADAKKAVAKATRIAKKEAKNEIAWLEEKLVVLREEKEQTLSRLRDFYAFGLTQLEDIVGVYEAPEVEDEPEEEVVEEVAEEVVEETTEAAEEAPAEEVHETVADFAPENVDLDAVEITEEVVEEEAVVEEPVEEVIVDETVTEETTAEAPAENVTEIVIDSQEYILQGIDVEADAVEEVENLDGEDIPAPVAASSATKAKDAAVNAPAPKAKRSFKDMLKGKK